MALKIIFIRNSVSLHQAALWEVGQVPKRKLFVIISKIESLVCSFDNLTLSHDGVNAKLPNERSLTEKFELFWKPRLTLTANLRVLCGRWINSLSLKVFPSKNIVSILGQHQMRDSSLKIYVSRPLKIFLLRKSISGSLHWPYLPS